MAEAERPLECMGCKNEPEVYYTEIGAHEVKRYIMCSSCPILQDKLNGVHLQGDSTLYKGKLSANRHCKRCGTTYESLLRGGLLGCANCYKTFENFLIRDVFNLKKNHVYNGRSPEEHRAMGPNLRLIALNEALKDSLAREDYEEAAWIRDQLEEIKKAIDLVNQKDLDG